MKAQLPERQRPISFNTFGHVLALCLSPVIDGQGVAVSHPRFTRRLAFAVLGITLICLCAFAGQAKFPGQYDQTIGDTRVVLLAISSAHFSSSTNSASNEGDTTNVEITFITEHIGTNSSRSPAAGSVLLYLQNKGQKESPLGFNGIGISSDPGLDIPPHLPQVKVKDEEACETTHVFLKGVHFPLGARVNCLIQRGYDGQLKDFRFNDILLPLNATNVLNQNGER